MGWLSATMGGDTEPTGRRTKTMGVFKRVVVPGTLVLAMVALGGCRRDVSTPETPPNAVSPDASTPTTDAGGSPGESTDEALTEGGFRSTPINPTRSAVLATQAEGSQINLRSQPTTQSTAQGYGLGGDQVTLLRLAEGEGGFSWYYVKFAESGAEGWVRGDFIDTSAAVDLAPGTQPGISTGPCGESDRPEAYFETKSFFIHLCQTPQGLSYIGINKSNNDTLTTADVSQREGTYIVINGNYQYHINDENLAVYQISSGSYNQLTNEPVIRHERFLNQN
ncbi:MAG: SH3 domain-containing protein [Cyanobacteria bacterium J06638_6]